MSWILIIYIIGCLINLILSIIIMRHEGKLMLVDVLGYIIMIALSWLSIIIVLVSSVIMFLDDSKIVLWKKKVRLP